MSEQILIVEDDLAMSSGIRDVLEMNGYRVQLAENGVEGLKMLEAYPTMRETIFKTRRPELYGELTKPVRPSHWREMAPLLFRPQQPRRSADA